MPLLANFRRVLLLCPYGVSSGVARCLWLYGMYLILQVPLSPGVFRIHISPYRKPRLALTTGARYWRSTRGVNMFEQAGAAKLLRSLALSPYDMT